MTDLLDLLREHSAWIFGSGGVAAFVLALLRMRQGKGAPAKAGNVTNRDNTTHSINIKQGAGPIEYGIGFSLVIAAIGGLMWIAGPSSGGGGSTVINATDGSVVNQGSGNTTTITNGGD